MSPERKTGCSFHLPDYSQGRLGTPRVQKPSHDRLDNENLVFADSGLHPGLWSLFILDSKLPGEHCCSFGEEVFKARVEQPDFKTIVSFAALFAETGRADSVKA